MTIKVKLEIKELLDAIKDGMKKLEVVTIAVKDPRFGLDAGSLEAALEVVAKAKDKLTDMEGDAEQLDKLSSSPSLAEMSTKDSAAKEKLSKEREERILEFVEDLREDGAKLHESTNNKLKEITGIDFIKALEPKDLVKNTM
jgi:hypothetical protein